MLGEDARGAVAECDWAVGDGWEERIDGCVHAKLGALLIPLGRVSSAYSGYLLVR